MTSFQFAGGSGQFGSLIPLPGIPDKVEKGGAWTLQRLIRETNPIPSAAPFALLAADSWYVPTQFRDYIAVGALVVILLFRPRRAAGLATR